MNESNFNQPDIMRIDCHSEEWKKAFIFIRTMTVV